MKKIQFYILFCLLTTIFACEQSYPDTIIINTTVQSVDDDFTQFEAVAIKDGKITELGTTEDISKLANKDQTKIIDLNGGFVMPGFIEGHGHFIGLGNSQQNLNLLDTKSWSEIIDMVDEKVADTKPGEWIIGRGWHQEKWSETPGLTVQGYPYHQALSAKSPDNPVILFHASGHGLIANQKAIEFAKIGEDTKSPVGGEIIKDADQKIVGMFEENAMELITKPYYSYLETLSKKEQLQKWQHTVDLAIQSCLEHGVTSFQDAGSKVDEIKRYTQLAKDGKLPIRLWAMVREPSDTIKNSLASLRVIDEGDRHFTCRAMKTELDGALGSYGAWLISSYSDKPEYVGQNTTTIEEVTAQANLALNNDMQLCCHAIGDKANQEFLKIVEATGGDNKRWRSEHAQIIDPNDIINFKKLGVIASMQAIHCTSDSPYVVDRLGEERAKAGAYAWKSLHDAGVVVTNGTDTPVEKIDPLASYYAMVTRKRSENEPAFFPEQCLSRKEALYAYTMANAYAAFEEEWKGSLEVGKVADIVILDQNILDCPEEDILKTKVLYTIVDGKIEFKNDESI